MNLSNEGRSLSEEERIKLLREDVVFRGKYWEAFRAFIGERDEEKKKPIAVVTDSQGIKWVICFTKKAVSDCIMDNVREEDVVRL